jgi:hypothetical protein
MSVRLPCIPTVRIPRRVVRPAVAHRRNRSPNRCVFCAHVPCCVPTNGGLRHPARSRRRAASRRFSFLGERYRPSHGRASLSLRNATERSGRRRAMSTPRGATPLRSQGRPDALLRPAPPAPVTCPFPSIRLKQALLAGGRAEVPGRCWVGSGGGSDGVRPCPARLVPR